MKLLSSSVSNIKLICQYLRKFRLQRYNIFTYKAKIYTKMLFCVQKKRLDLVSTTADFQKITHGAVVLLTQWHVFHEK